MLKKPSKSPSSFWTTHLFEDGWNIVRPNILVNLFSTNKVGTAQPVVLCWYPFILINGSNLTIIPIGAVGKE